MLNLDVGGLVKGVGGVIDKLFTSDEERQQAKLKLLELHQAGELQKIAESSQIIQAEAKSEHFLTSSWRPITMLVFVAIIANNYIIAPYAEAMFGTSVGLDIPPDMWDLLKIGLGGYVVSRGGEKIASNLSKNK